MSDEKKIAIGIITAVVSFVGIPILFGLGTTVDPGQVGILVRLGEVQDGYLDDGFHTKRPIVDSVIQVDARVRKMEISAQAGSKDLQTIKTVVAVNYRFTKEKIPEIYRQIGNEEAFEQTVLQPATHEAVKAVMAKYNAEELLKTRAAVRDAMEHSLREKLNVILDGAFIVSAFNVIDFDFTASFNAAIEAKQVAEQKAQQAQNEIILEKAEADKKIEQARGQAESAQKQAEGEAKAIKVMAQARADAIALEGKALQANPQILRLRMLEKWNGQLPRVTGTGSSGFDLILTDK